MRTSNFVLYLCFFNELCEFLSFRLGEAEKATYHYKHSGSLIEREDIAKAEAVQKHLNRCNEARKLKDWDGLLKETQYAISFGADSAPPVSFLE